MRYDDHRYNNYMKKRLPRHRSGRV